MRKLFEVGDIIERPMFAGRCCLGRLNTNLLVKLEFVCSKYTGNYDALQITLINPNGGLVDKIMLFFADLLEVKKNSYDFNFPGGEPPYIWVDAIRAEWYAVKPTKSDYMAIRKAVADYVNVFR